MKIHAWIALGLVFFFTVQALVAEAVDLDHAAISKRVLKETEKKFGPEAVSRLIAWSDLINNNRDKSVAEKLKLTNNFFNRIPIRNETALWGHIHWSTPFEMLTRNAGSHADHVVGKYVTLEALGTSIDHLQITHVHSAATSDPTYMVLTYRSEPKAIPLVLDTVNGEIISADKRDDLFPEDSINDNGLWLSNVQKDGRTDAQTEANAHIELWNEMNARMDKEFLSVEDPSLMW